MAIVILEIVKMRPWYRFNRAMLYAISINREINAEC